MIELRIDPEFRDKIPPMPEEDFQGLREDILRDGYVRDPLVVWEEENILLDGHHRWRVIQENQELLGDKFTVDYKSFPDRYACIAWICANQLHKHNMNEFQRMKLLQEEHDARQKTHGGDRGTLRDSFGHFTASGENDHLPSEVEQNALNFCKENRMKTRAEIAIEHNISPEKVRAAVEVGRGIDRAAEVDPDFKKEVLSGELKASKKDVANIRKLKDDEEVKSAIEEIRNPKPKTISNPNLPKKERSKKSEEDREIEDRVSKILEMQKDNTRDASVTIDDLLRMVEADGEDYVSSLRNTLVVRSTLLVGENREKVANVISEIIEKISKVKELLE